MDETQTTAARPAHDLTPVVDLTLHHGAGPFVLACRTTSRCCRLATTPARPARTSRPGSRWRRPANIAARGRR